MSAPNYSMLDVAIVMTIHAGKHPLDDRRVNDIAFTIAVKHRRDADRVIDGRLQALRKAGKIRAVRTAPAGWVVVGDDK